MPSPNPPPERAAQPGAPDEGPAKTRIEDGVAVVEALARAARQVSLYGQEHPVSLSATARAVDLLESRIPDQDIEIAADEEDLFWNGAALPASHPHVSWLRESMRQRLIASIALHPPVRAEEVVRLLGIAAWLESCQQIAPEDSDTLAQVVEKCLEVQRWSDAPPPTTLPVSADPSYGEDRSSQELLAEGLARLIQRTGENTHFPDEEARRTWRLNVMQSLNALPPEWRASLFRSASGASPGFPDMLTLIAREMSVEECVSLVLDSPGAITKERSGGLRRLLTRIMSDPDRTQAIAPRLHQAALEAGIEEQLYQNVVGVLLTEIRQGGSDGLIAEPAHPASVAADAPPQEAFSDLVPAPDAHTIRRARSQLLVDLTECDLSEVQRAVVFRALGDHVEQCLRDGDTELALEEIRTLFRLTQEGGEQTRELAEQTLARIDASAAAQALLEAAEEGAGEERVEAILLLGCLGRAGMEALVSLAQRPNSDLAAGAVKMLAARDGPLYEHLEKLLMSLSLESVGVVLPVLLSSGDDDLLARLHVLTQHPDVAVRSEVVRLARGCRRAEMTEMLVKFARDEELEVRLPAIAALGERRAKGAVPALCALIRGATAHNEPVVVREAAIAALGNIGSARAVGALAEVLGGGGLLGRLRAPALRVAAARALGAIGSPEAKAALSQYTRSRHRAVRDACQQELSALETPVHLSPSMIRPAAGVGARERTDAR